jgi:hypothetical protein
MRNHLLAAGIAVAILIPTLAFAQESCEQQHDNRVAGTVGGGVLGALIGSSIAGHGDKTTGAVVGGVGGAVIGNQLTKGGADCAHAYGYYDGQGAWHANGTARADARGYYDRSGRWVDGAPQGAYNSHGVWVAEDTRVYYDNRRDWEDGQTDFASRAAWLDQRIQTGRDDGSLSRVEARRAERSLEDIRRQERGMRRYSGQLRPADAAALQGRLDTLRQNIRWTRQNSERNN